MAAKKKSAKRVKTPAPLMRPAVIGGNPIGNLSFVYVEAEHVLPPMKVIKRKARKQR